MSLTTEERESATALLESAERLNAKGDVVIDTPTLLSWIRSNKNSNRGVDPTWATKNLDPDGRHIAQAILLHNDAEFRLHILAKTIGSMDPAVLWQDVSMQEWSRARDGMERMEAQLRELLAA